MKLSKPLKIQLMVTSIGVRKGATDFKELYDEIRIPQLAEYLKKQKPEVQPFR